VQILQMLLNMIQIIN